MNTIRTYLLTTCRAIDPMTGREESFTIEHDTRKVLAVRYADGVRVPQSGETFTEVSEAFWIDRERMAALGANLDTLDPESADHPRDAYGQ